MIDKQLKLHVCKLTSVHPYNDIRIYFKECYSLAKTGYNMHLIAPGAPDNLVEIIHLYSVPKVKSNLLKRMIKTIWDVYIKALEINADLYHFHDPELIPIGLILKAKGKKVIYDVHEDVPRQILSKEYIPRLSRRIVSKLTESIENFACKHFDAIVTATPYICDRFSKLGCNAVNINNYPILSELHIPEINWEEKEKAVCYVGGIWEQRGIYEMVKAIGQTNTKLLLAGNFSSTEQRNKVVSMSGWANVKELGYLDRKGVADTLAKSIAGLVVLHPIINYLDALPVKMFEYMSAGIPVIASNFPLWKEIIEGNKCGICVDPMNPKAIAKAIQWIVDNPNEAKRMGENGRKAVEEKYNWENEADKLRALYKELQS
ncbi:glycosyltransferase family 4 protein [Mastigocoleus sp. MO_188.B34]|uniref:glycosyltransferase family 4 protein n=1 Tax=Mastigocoleus sp. MO_188.B34 TaxID=3036635 RepID=UPI002624F052|nr:glycosyltransferase family 4 protein [Mastigocoleus sp. MO_188.B34]MDJ0696057.1 glycosyltransferase family 4 protein [Mastigocoleus sp. MO_188.B34]